MDASLVEAASAQMRRRAPARALEDAPESKRARDASARLEYAGACALVTETNETAACLATCVMGRERACARDLARALSGREDGGEDASWRPVKLAARGATLLRARDADADASGACAAATRAARDGRAEVSNVVEKAYPIDGAYVLGDVDGMKRACAAVVRAVRRRSADARATRVALAVAYRRLENVGGERVDERTREDGEHSRRALTTSVATAVARAFEAEDASCEVFVDLKRPAVVVFASALRARLRDGSIGYVIGVGAFGRDEDAFEVKSSGIFPVSARSLAPKKKTPKTPTPKRLAKKDVVVRDDGATRELDDATAGVI